jgi:hypothetical protein
MEKIPNRSEEEKETIASAAIEYRGKIFTGIIHSDALEAAIKENGTYKLGTTVRIETDDKKNTFYFVVNSHKLNDSRVEASESGLSVTLSGLWSYISTYGAKENIAMPLLGTGNGRLKMPREEVYKEIVRSFIASCSGKNYCERMTIVVREDDIAKYKINVDELVEFTKLNTKYADFARNITPSGANSIE